MREDKEHLWRHPSEIRAERQTLIMACLVGGGLIAALAALLTILML